MKNKLIYTDSLGIKNHLNYNVRSYPNLMEFIRDLGLEDWGDCRGRAWCATCHVSISKFNDLPLPDQDERARLTQLSNTRINSRLACQIYLDSAINQLKITYLGDD